MAGCSHFGFWFEYFTFLIRLRIENQAFSSKKKNFKSNESKLFLRYAMSSNCDRF